MKETDRKWILQGYKTFAFNGLPSLKVEQLAKDVGISKSSFYHHFSDIEVFKERLLQEHLNNARLIAEKERMATSIQPELISILIAHKIDLLFHRQLRFNANHPDYGAALKKANALIGTDFVKLFLKDTKIPLTMDQAAGFFELALENFFLQINPDNLNRAWLNAYFDHLKDIAKNFVRPLYGNV